MSRKQCISRNDVIQICINGQSLTRVDNYRYLGVIYDCNIRWALHINKIVKKQSTLPTYSTDGNIHYLKNSCSKYIMDSFTAM